MTNPKIAKTMLLNGLQQTNNMKKLMKIFQQNKHGIKTVNGMKNMVSKFIVYIM